MNNFQESGINFCFQPDWLVFKYDEHPAHKKVDNYSPLSLRYRIKADRLP